MALVPSIADRLDGRRVEQKVLLELHPQVRYPVLAQGIEQVTQTARSAIVLALIQQLGKQGQIVRPEEGHKAPFARKLEKVNRQHILSGVPSRSPFLCKKIENHKTPP